MHSSFMQKKKDFPDKRKLAALGAPVPYDLFLLFLSPSILNVSHVIPTLCLQLGAIHPSPVVPTERTYL